MEFRREHTETVVVSKPLFVLFSLAFLTAAVRLHSGGVRLGEVRRALRWEARADIASIREDVHTIRTEAGRAPRAIESLWIDMRRYIRTVEADAGADARKAGERISSLVKTT